MHLAATAFTIFSDFATAYVALISLTYLTSTILAFFSIRAYLRTRNKERIEQIFRSRLVPPISILCPAYNEGVTIVESVRSLLRLLYSQHEVVVINDGSKDDTLERLVEAFQMQRIDQRFDLTLPSKPIRGVYISQQYPKLVVIDKENGGKADALNGGINASRYPIFCAVDADTVLEEEALLHLVSPMLDLPVFVPVVGGMIRAANGAAIVRGSLERVNLPRKPIELFQIVEYFRAFLAGRTAQASMNIMLIVSGAFGLFHKATVKAVGGYETGTVGEDMELVVRISRFLRDRGVPYEISFIPQTVCWTEVPPSWSTLGKQRNRWHRGMLETLVKHGRMFANPHYGRAGMLGMTYFWIIEVFGPIVELLGYCAIPLALALHALAPVNAGLFLLVSIGFGITISVSALALEESSFHRYETWHEIFTLAAYAVMENFGYRQLTLYWRLAGTVDFLRKKKAWGEQKRAGFMPAKTSEARE